MAAYACLEDWFVMAHYFVKNQYGMSTYEALVPWEREVFASIIVKEHEDLIKELERQRGRA